MAATTDFVIARGKTFSHILRWEAPPFLYKPITGITQTAPVKITAVAHGVPDGWRVAVVSVKGMSQINAQNSPPKASDYRKATVVDVDHIELNDVNAADFKPYASGGYVQCLTPVDLSGFSARMSIKDKVGGVELLRLDTTNGGIVLDTVGNTIALLVDAVATAAITWKKGVYDLEMVSADVVPVVTLLLSGSVTVAQEVTTT